MQTFIISMYRIYKLAYKSKWTFRDKYLALYCSKWNWQEFELEETKSLLNLFVLLELTQFQITRTLGNSDHENMFFL